jgi:1-deoxy-D-xylulose-5-phosphate reductoisomerase
VISRNPNEYRVTILTAHSNYQKLFEQCLTHSPEIAVLVCEDAAEELKKLLKEHGLEIKVRTGAESLNQVAAVENCDTVIAAIVGAAGLLPTITAVEAGHKVLLANKEALVMSGDLFMSKVKQHDACLLPVDSEHNAIFQSLPMTSHSTPTMNGVKQILLTGSGGPFLKEPLSSLASKTPDEACAHPNWEMGRKISVDSATMMNKGLELIEACYLFGLSFEQIQIVIHPQSIIHSMVSYIDGSVISQMGNPDMRTPIAHCLAWPERIDAGVEPLDFFNMKALHFEKPDFERFPCLRLAVKAIQIGKSAPCILNAANEVAVDAFLNNRIQFTQIAEVIEQTLEQSSFSYLEDINSILSADKSARDLANLMIKGLK